MMEDDVGASVLMEVEDLETAVMRAHLALQQFIRERKRDKEFDVDELPVGGVVSLSFSLLPEVRRQLKVVRNWLRNSQTIVKKMEFEEVNEYSAFVGPEEKDGYYAGDPLTGVTDEEGEISNYSGMTPKGKRRRHKANSNSGWSGSGSSEGEDDQPKGKDPNRSKVKDRRTREEDPAFIVLSSTERKAISKRPNSSTPNSRHTCEKCGKLSVEFLNSTDMSRHLQKPPCGVKVGYECPYCKKVLSRKDKLKTHIKHFHPLQDDDDEDNEEGGRLKDLESHKVIILQDSSLTTA